MAGGLGSRRAAWLIAVFAPFENRILKPLWMHAYAANAQMSLWSMIHDVSDTQDRLPRLLQTDSLKFSTASFRVQVKSAAGTDSMTACQLQLLDCMSIP